MLTYKIAVELYDLMKWPPRTSTWYRFVDKLDADDWMKCWEWKAGRTKDNYGNFSSNKQRKTASRWMGEWVYGPLPKGWVIDHRVCDNPPCVNPLHLLPCPERENILRNSSPASKYARATHCLKGHKLGGDNVNLSHKNYYGEHVRACKECARRRGKDWAAKNYEINKEKMRTVAREWQRKKLADPVAREKNREYQRQRLAKKRALAASG